MDRIVASVQDINVTVLVNDIGGVVGIVSPEFKTLTTHTTREVNDLIGRNGRFMTHVTRALIPLLEKNQPSLILNIGSMGAVITRQQRPKTWLNAEMKAENKDIEVLRILVGNTRTDLRPGVVESAMTPSLRTMAKAALNKVGCGKSALVGCFPHAL